MTKAELAALEREVEEARGRVVYDIARLRDPETLSTFKSDMMEEYHERRDKFTGEARDRATGVMEDIKGRMLANPLAVAAIGAGVAYRLWRHPPIASLLIGAGAYSLMNTKPAESGSDRDMIAQASKMASSISDEVQDRFARATAAASDAVTSVREQIEEGVSQASEAIASARQQVEQGLHQAAERVSQTVSHVTGNGHGSPAGRRTERLAGGGFSADGTMGLTEPVAYCSTVTVTEHDGSAQRDAVLLGLAGLAVMAAVGVSFQRRAEAPYPGRHLRFDR